jgi:hypothetical protein
VSVATTTPDLRPTPRRKRVLWKWSLAVTGIVVLYFAWEFSSGFYEGYTRAGAKVLDFHVDFNGENYDRIYDHATGALHAEPSQRDKFVKTLAALHAKLGNARRSSLDHIEVTITNGEPLVITRYQTYFDSGSAVETFSWGRENGMLKLSQYSVSSDALVFN